MATSDSDAGATPDPSATPDADAKDGDDSAPAPTGDDANKTEGDDKPKDDGALAKQLREMQSELDKTKAANEELLKQARKHESRAKANADAAKQLEEIRTRDLPEAERAIEAARKEGRAQALTEFGQRLAKAEFRAAAAQRIDDAKLDVILDGLNLAKFVDEDGEPTVDAIKAYIESILPPAPAKEPEPAPKAPEADPFAPRPSGSTPDTGQGAGRGAAPEPLNGDGIQHALERAIGMRR